MHTEFDCRLAELDMDISKAPLVGIVLVSAIPSLIPRELLYVVMKLFPRAHVKRVCDLYEPRNTGSFGLGRLLPGNHAKCTQQCQSEGGCNAGGDAKHLLAAQQVSASVPH